MKMLIVSLNYAPELTGIGKYSGEMSEWLSVQGHDVRVITAPPYYPEWKKRPGYAYWRYRAEVIKGVRVWRCPLWVPGRQSGLKRILHLASFAISCIPPLLLNLAWRPDVVLCIEPPLLSAPASLVAARLSGAKAILHVQDFEVDAAFNLGLLSSTVAKRAVLGLEAVLMRAFDQVSTISNSMLSRLRAKGLPEEKTILFPNWVDIDQIHPDKASSGLFREDLGIPQDQVVLLYSGNLGQKQGLDVLVEAAYLLRHDPGLLFVICGDGAAKETLKAQAEDLSNVRFLPLQPAERFNDLLNLADIHLLPQRADAADLVMPSKLAGMLACGGCVIATAAPGTEVGVVIEKAGGVICEPGNPRALADCILDLVQEPERREAMRTEARRYAVGHLRKDEILRGFLNAVQMLAQAVEIRASARDAM